MTDEIFISYTRSDRERAKIFAEALEKQGYSVWWDRKIPIGRMFDEVIEEKLAAAKCVVVLWSRESIKSKWVKTEATDGDSRGILVPVLIEDVKPPLAFRLIEAAKLIDWKGDLADPDFELLLESVSGFLGPPGVHKMEIQKLGAGEKVEIEKEEKTFTNSIGMKFTLIPAGEFMMGSEETERENPVHEIRINKPFYIGIYPVTQKEWKAVMEKNSSYFKGDNLPVEYVSWNDVQEFIKKLNEKESTSKYRLPSEAEWEYAARAGTATRYSFGDDESELGEYAWYTENSGSKTHPIGAIASS
jgi:formylglycine-generating enzyme required for sulfatase activity